MKSNLVAFHMRCSCMLFTFGTQPIGKGRFRILGGGQGLEYCGGEGGGGGRGRGNFPAGTWRCNDVDAT